MSPVVNLVLLVLVLTAEIRVKLGVEWDHEAVQPVLDVVDVHVHVHARTRRRHGRDCGWWVTGVKVTVGAGVQHSVKLGPKTKVK